ncbi:MAG TPA: hypothetical protein PLA01_00650 [Acetivibrio sp.]|nr:hypothetical protein [Acetivibrio sp.]
MILRKTAFTIILTTALLLSFSACQSGSTQNNAAPTDNGSSSESASNLDTTLSQENSSSNNNLANEANSTDYIEKLKSEGANEKEIESAELYVKRVMLQLNEIQTFSNNSGFHLSAADPGLYNQDRDDSLKYLELSSKIDEKKAVYYILKLMDGFGSMDKAFDEYLISLQLDIDLDMYITDKNSYGRLRSEKLSGIIEEDLITAEKIDEKAFESLQKLNDANKNNYPNTGNEIYDPFDNSVPNVINPQPNIPQVDVPRPINPAEEINKKLSPYN